MPSNKFLTENFDGFVVTKEWTHMPTGEQYTVFAGKVSIVEDNDMIGFEVSGRETNWIARIEGPTGTSVNIPGCQVRAVGSLNGPFAAEGAKPANVYMVP